MSTSITNTMFRVTMKIYTTEHQPRLQKALKAASIEALPLEKRVAVLRGSFTSLQNRFDIIRRL